MKAALSYSSMLTLIDMKYVGRPIMDDFSFSYLNTFDAFPPYGVERPVFLVQFWKIPELNKFYVNNNKFPTFSISPPLPTAPFACYETAGSFISKKGKLISVASQISTPAQGISKPESLFNNHGVIDIDGVIYDPSYGTPPINGGITEWERVSVSGYAVESYYMNQTTHEIYPLIWPYENEEPSQQLNYYKH